MRRVIASSTYMGASVSFSRVMANGPTGWVRVAIDSGLGDVLHVMVPADELLSAVRAETEGSDR